jgi:hypothetical protein
MQLARHPQPGLIEPGHPGAIRSRSTVRKSLNPSAARSVTVATVPSETGVPNNSANACAVRFFDRNWPT